jgi:dephospho-CoA kinase
LNKRGKRPYIVGMTGGIGSGKSTVSRMFQDLGAEVIDADDISRALLQPGSPVLAEVEHHFGRQIFQDDVLDRSKLRQLVFTDQTARTWLEQLLHPLIRTEINRHIEISSRDWILLSIPLLLENRDYAYVDAVLVIDTPETVQIARTRVRDNTTEEEVAKIMAAQISRKDRLMAADMVIHNDADLPQLQRQVSALYERIEAEAHGNNY